MTAIAERPSPSISVPEVGVKMTSYIYCRVDSLESVRCRREHFRGRILMSGGWVED